MNPAVAVLLGWAFGGEDVSTTLVLGLLLIAASIALVGTDSPALVPIAAGERRERSLDHLT